jgi:queuine tRNA-ribosyltransferase subunit QTRTD1
MEKPEFFEIIRPEDPSVVGPRLGQLTVQGRSKLETPNFLAVSSRGVVPHMTPDVIAANSLIGGVHMALEDCKPRSRSCVYVPLPN